MVKITETAYSRLADKLTNQPEGVAVRITVRKGRVRFRPSRQQEGDTVFQHAGQSLLLVGNKTSRRIANRTLDTVSTTEGDRLRFVRPR